MLSREKCKIGVHLTTLARLFYSFFSLECLVCLDGGTLAEKVLPLESLKERSKYLAGLVWEESQALSKFMAEEEAKFTLHLGLMAARVHYCSVFRTFASMPDVDNKRSASWRTETNSMKAEFQATWLKVAAGQLSVGGDLRVHPADEYWKRLVSRLIPRLELCMREGSRDRRKLAEERLTLLQSAFLTSDSKYYLWQDWIEASEKDEREVMEEQEREASRPSSVWTPLKNKTHGGGDADSLPPILPQVASVPPTLAIVAGGTDQGDVVKLHEEDDEQLFPDPESANTLGADLGADQEVSQLTARDRKWRDFSAPLQASYQEMKGLRESARAAHAAIDQRSVGRGLLAHRGTTREHISRPIARGVSLSHRGNMHSSPPRRVAFRDPPSPDQERRESKGLPSVAPVAGGRGLLKQTYMVERMEVSFRREEVDLESDRLPRQRPSSPTPAVAPVEEQGGASPASDYSSIATASPSSPAGSPPKEPPHKKRAKSKGPKPLKHPNPAFHRTKIRHDALPSLDTTVGHYRLPPIKGGRVYTIEEGVRQGEEPWRVRVEGEIIDLSLLQNDWWCPRRYALGSNREHEVTLREVLLYRAIEDVKCIQAVGDSRHVQPFTWLDVWKEVHRLMVERTTAGMARMPPWMEYERNLRSERVVARLLRRPDLNAPARRAIQAPAPPPNLPVVPSISAPVPPRPSVSAQSSPPPPPPPPPGFERQAADVRKVVKESSEDPTNLPPGLVRPGGAVGRAPELDPLAPLRKFDPDMLKTVANMLAEACDKAKAQAPQVQAAQQQTMETARFQSTQSAPPALGGMLSIAPLGARTLVPARMIMGPGPTVTNVTATVQPPAAQTVDTKKEGPKAPTYPPSGEPITWPGRGSSKWTPLLVRRFAGQHIEKGGDPPPYYHELSVPALMAGLTPQELGSQVARWIRTPIVLARVMGLDTAACMDPIPPPGALLAPLFNHLPKRTTLGPATLQTDGTPFRQDVFAVLASLQYWTGKYYRPGHEFHQDRQVAGAVRDFVTRWVKNGITTAQWEGGLYQTVRAMAARGPATFHAGAPVDASTIYCPNDPTDATLPTRRIRWGKLMMGTGQFALSKGKTHATKGQEENTGDPTDDEEGDGASPFLENLGVDTDDDTEEEPEKGREENMEVTAEEDAMLDE